jgi:hypothetical protein
LKAWPARGSFRVFGSRWNNYDEIARIDTHETHLRLTPGYVQLLFKIVHPMDDADIERCRRDRSEFIGRGYGPISETDNDLWYEPQHAALQSRVDALLEVE